MGIFAVSVNPTFIIFSIKIDKSFVIELTLAYVQSV